MYRDEFSKNREALDLMVKMRSGGGNAAPRGGSVYTPANKVTSLFGMLIIASAVVPLGVLGGIIPKSAVANVPLLNELPGMSSPAPRGLREDAPSSRAQKGHKHGHRAAHLKVSHRATGRILNAG